MKIEMARTQADILLAKQLFRQYVLELGVNLDFQSFEQELENLPGEYALPKGVLLLAFEAQQCVGCVAIRDLGHFCCEMKRLYVTPENRGKGFAKALALESIRQAQLLDYKCMRLDTLDRLKAAVMLYHQLGFEVIDAYYENPLKGVVYFQKKL